MAMSDGHPATAPGNFAWLAEVPLQDPWQSLRTPPCSHSGCRPSFLAVPNVVQEEQYQPWLGRQPVEAVHLPSPTTAGCTGGTLLSLGSVWDLRLQYCLPVLQESRSGASLPQVSFTAAVIVIREEQAELAELSWSAQQPRVAGNRTEATPGEGAFSSRKWLESC